MSFKKNESAGYLANHVARIFARGLAERIKPLGITIGTFPVLLELWEADGLTQKQLVDRLNIEQATMANTLARMERDGLIIRNKDKTDRRVQRIWLAERAREIRDAAVAAAMQVNASTLAGLSETERRQFIALMQKVIKTSRNSDNLAN